MERLTRKSDTSDMVWFIDREHESGYAEREPCEMDAHHARLAIAKLAEYEDMEEQGKLLKVPCAVGTTVYVKMQSGRYAKAEVRDFTYFLTCGPCIVVTSDKFDKQNIPFWEFGKTVFLTRPKTKAAIQEVNHDRNHMY